MRNYIEIGSTPVNEDCQQLGDGYIPTLAQSECKRFRELIRQVCGMEVGTASLGIKANAHDFGTYYEVVCYFSDDDELGQAYAYHVESNAPMNWSDLPGSALFDATNSGGILRAMVNASL